MKDSLLDDAILSPRARLRPSLLTLPPEIKTQILEQITQRDLRSVSRVNTEFSTLAEPFLWQDLDVTRSIQRDLRYFVETIVPRHIHVLKSITFSQAAYTDFGLRSRTEDFIKAATPDGPPQHDLLLSPMIASFPMRVTVQFVFYRLPLEFEDHSADRDNERVPGRREMGTLIPRALAAVGDRVEVLALVGDEGFPSIDLSGGRLATFLSHFPSLSTLCLEVVLDVKERESLQSTIASLRHLKSLVVKGNHLFSDSSATITWECPLERLSLATQDPFPLSSLTNLLGHFSTTLTNLDLCMPRYLTPVDPALLATPFPLPRVRNLNLDTLEPASSLAAFSLCPLEHLTIGSCPSISPDEWEAFIKSHAGTLRRVNVGRLARSLGSENTEGMRTLCEEKGIEFELEGEDELSESDGDSDGDTGWL